ncbi:signal peptidase II [Halomonas sp. Cn5-12]|uniref:signal peptidase II n=1 Tax=Halomonas sp. Cn5-12 TaxID=2908885 RepID=UPI003FA5B5B2
MEHRCRIQSFCGWWRLAALFFYRNRGSGLDFLIKLILENRHKGEAIAYSLILGGAMGNLIDRVFRGYVVDSFDFYWRDWHWPAFNLADIAIVLGALLFVSSSLLGKKANTNAEPDGSD